MRLKLKICCLILLPITNVFSADTLKINANKADSLFLKNNLSLIAAQYNISLAKALKIQAKVYPNPTIYFEQSLINKTTRSDYDTDPTRTGTDERVVNVNQLILLAGKRNKQIKLADINTKLTEVDFENLLRTLRFQLHNNISQLYYNQLALRLLIEEQQSIDKLSDNIDEQVKKGFISLSEGVRIQSLLLEIDKEINDYTNTNYDIIGELNVILNLPPTSILKVDELTEISRQLPAFNACIDTATINNPDLKKANYLIDYAKAQYALNKALAVPDANIQLSYDKSGNYIKNYYGLGIGINLPTFNRNQGNIKASRFQINQSETQLKVNQQTVYTQIFSNYNSLQNNITIANNYSTLYENQLLQLMDKVLESYQKRLISLTDFTNYYESYKQGYLSLLSIKASLILNAEQLNFLIGKPIIK